jgi:hypothetical protein
MKYRFIKEPTIIWGCTVTRIVFIMCSIFLFHGCSTAPGTYSYKNNQSFNRTYDEVWEDLVRFFATHNIQVKNIAKDSGVIYAESARFDDELADCGSPGINRVVNRLVNLNVFVSRSEARPTVHVNSKFTETRQFDRNLHTVECNSKGVIESSILRAVRGGA